MKQSDSLELVAAGTLARPGLIGRAVRLVLGALCLYALTDIVQHAAAIATRPLTSLVNLAILIGVAICLFNYVVNIGFGRSWGWRPLLVLLAVLPLAAGAGFLVSGSLDSTVFGVPLVLWLGYFYAHLGISFVVAALLATPGCEMRSIPVALIVKIDDWERRLRHP